MGNARFFLSGSFTPSCLRYIQMEYLAGGRVETILLHVCFSSVGAGYGAEFESRWPEQIDHGNMGGICRAIIVDGSERSI